MKDSVTCVIINGCCVVILYEARIIAQQNK